MIVKKTGGRIFGAQLTAAERKALEIEVRNEVREFDQKNQINIEALILWAMHELLGFGPKRLRRFYLGFARYYDELLAHCDMEDDDAFLALRALKQLGVDVEAWHKEEG